MIVVSFPRSNANVRALVNGLYREGLLESFHTTLQFEADHPAVKIMPEGLRKQLLRRSFDIPASLTRTYPELELARLLCEKLRLTAATRGPQSWASVDRTCRHLDRSVSRYLASHARRGGRGAISAVYCYEDSAIETFKSATEYGVRTLYELTTPYYGAVHSIMRKAAESRPDWACTLQALQDAPEKLARKDEELQRSDVIFCISEFVRNSIPAQFTQGKKVEIVRYGIPQMTGLQERRPPDASKPLRVLFVGTLSQSKGLADLFDAIRMLGRKDIELVVLGAPVVALEFYRRQLAEFTYHPPSSHSEVLSLMQTCDVLAFPSLAEGRGMVQLEAMRCQLPLITTKNATGDELIEDGVSGFVVPVASPESLAEKLAWFADHRLETWEMGKHAQTRAQQWQWKNYVHDVVAVIREQIENGTGV